MAFDIHWSNMGKPQGSSPLWKLLVQGTSTHYEGGVAAKLDQEMGMPMGHTSIMDALQQSRTSTGLNVDGDPEMSNSFFCDWEVNFAEIMNSILEKML